MWEVPTTFFFNNFNCLYSTSQTSRPARLCVFVFFFFLISDAPYREGVARGPCSALSDLIFLFIIGHLRRKAPTRGPHTFASNPHIFITRSLNYVFLVIFFCWISDWFACVCIKSKCNFVMKPRKVCDHAFFASKTPTNSIIAPNLLLSADEFTRWFFKALLV